MKWNGKLRMALARSNRDISFQPPLEAEKGYEVTPHDCQVF
jgi:hypothetical protein